MESGVPIVLTRNGYGEMVIMSVSLYEVLFTKLHVASSINEALAQVEKGDKSIDWDVFFKDLKIRYGNLL